jgi:hypothetical protein
MRDDQLIDLVAYEWIHGGGDSDGFSYCRVKILERIKWYEDKIKEGWVG